MKTHNGRILDIEWGEDNAMSAAAWRSLSRDVEEGAARFWAKRGGKPPTLDALTILYGKHNNREQKEKSDEA